MSDTLHSNKTVIHKVGGVIVTYHPNIEILLNLISQVSDQLDLLVVIDNTPDLQKCAHHQDLINHQFSQATYIALGDNLGIATAQNEAIKVAIQNDCDHIFFMDQDSRVDVDIVRRLLLAEQSLLKQGINVGVVGPCFKDIKTDHYADGIRHRGIKLDRIKISDSETKPVLVDYLISSGSLVRTSVLKNVGLMRDELFIDWVDVDWGLRAMRHGYQNYMITSVRMAHDIGDSIVSFMGREISLHNDVRNYYIVRNAVHLFFDPKIQFCWRVSILAKIPVWILFYSFYSTSGQKFKSLLRMILAVGHGLVGRLGRYNQYG